MLAPLDTLQHLKARLAEYGADIASTDRTGYISLILGLPETPSAAPQSSRPLFQLVHRHREEIRAGYGVCDEWRAAGPQRLSVLRQHALDLARSWRLVDPDDTGFQGFALLGLAARADAPVPTTKPALPNALLWLPEVALHVRRGQAALVLTARQPCAPRRVLRRWNELLDDLVPRLMRPPAGPLRPARLRRGLETPDAGGWRLLVESALRQIASDSVQKVVVARRLRVESSRHIDLARLITALGFFFPSCQLIDIRRGDATIVAATPERLVSLRGNHIETDALAGTTSRAGSEQRDRALAQALRSSEKDLREHRLVVEALRTALDLCAGCIDAPATPEIMRLSNAQHLWTKISATCGTGSDLFTLAEHLHPTPATNGAPRRTASEWLGRHEHFDRGWYTGAAGILEPDLTGELWVLLRCATIRDRSAELYAGSGIVTGSDPTLEWRETEQKLAAMLTSLRYA